MSRGRAKNPKRNVESRTTGLTGLVRDSTSCFGFRCSSVLLRKCKSYDPLTKKNHRRCCPCDSGMSTPRAVARGGAHRSYYQYGRRIYGSNGVVLTRKRDGCGNYADGGEVEAVQTAGEIVGFVAWQARLVVLMKIVVH